MFKFLSALIFSSAVSSAALASAVVVTTQSEINEVSFDGTYKSAEAHFAEKNNMNGILIDVKYFDASGVEQTQQLFFTVTPGALMSGKINDGRRLYYVDGGLGYVVATSGEDGPWVTFPTVRLDVQAKEITPQQYSFDPIIVINP